MGETIMKRIIPFVLLFCLCVGGWGKFIYTQMNATARFNRQWQQAEELYEKKIPDEALEAYLSCLAMEPKNQKVLQRVSDLYLQLKQYEKARKTCETLETVLPGDTDNLLRWADSFLEESRYADAVAVLEKGNAKALQEKIREIKGQYTLSYMPISYFLDWCGAGTQMVAAVVTDTGTAAIYAASGRRLFGGDFSWAGGPSEDGSLYPVCQEGQFLFADAEGNRRLVPEQLISSLGPIASGYAPVSLDGMFGYMDTELQLQEVRYSKTYAFQEGYALAQQDGGLVLLDGNLQVVLSCPFSSVVEDPYGFSSTYGVMVGNDNGLWSLYGPNGEALSSFSAEELRLPQEKNGLLAFRQDSLWGFVNQQGSVVIQPSFADAKSFSEGYAAVKIGDKWGYIDETGTTVIDPVFDEAGPISKEGTAFVRNSAGVNVLKLNWYE